MQEVLQIIIIILLTPRKKDFQVLPLSWVILTSHSLPSNTSFPQFTHHCHSSCYPQLPLFHLSSGTQVRSFLPCPEVSILNTSLSHPYQLLLRTDSICSCLLACRSQVFDIMFHDNAHYALKTRGVKRGKPAIVLSHSPTL